MKNFKYPRAFPIMPGTHSEHQGLSKREYFAAKAMEGVLADSTTLRSVREAAKDLGQDSTEYLAKKIIEISDAVLAELDAQYEKESAADRCEGHEV